MGKIGLIHFKSRYFCKSV